MRRRLAKPLVFLVLSVIVGTLLTLLQFAVSMQEAPTYFLRDLHSSNVKGHLPVVVWDAPKATRIIGYASASALGMPPESCDLSSEWSAFGGLIWTDAQHQRIEEFIPSWSRVRLSPNDLPENDRVLIIEDARGTPFRWLRSLTIVHCGTNGWTPEIVEGGALPPLMRMATHPWLDFRASPRRVMLSGFVKNLIVHWLMSAAFVFGTWLLWSLAFSMWGFRARSRLKRGLCPKCAYPVGTWGGERCTECGATHTVKPGNP